MRDGVMITLNYESNYYIRLKLQGTALYYLTLL